VTEHLIQYLESMVEIARVWGPLLIFVFMTIESSFIPFPSEVVMIPAGFMAARGELPPGPALPALLLAIFLGILGSLVGAWINYVIALKLGRPLLHKYGKWLFLKPEALDRAEALFREYGDVTTFVCRLLPAIRQLISLPAGLARMNAWRFNIFTGLGAGLWVTILALMGYHFGRISREMSYAELVHICTDMLKHNLVWIALGCAVIFALYVWVHKRIMRGRKPA
jgi:membrane protein DedA with SNARE-associated domain